MTDAEAGWEAYVANDMATARDRFQAAVDRCANDHYARTGLGYVELRAGDEEEAERLWSRVVEAEPNNVDALVGLGLARWRAGDLDAVETFFTRVVALEPGHPTAVDYLERLDGSASGPAAADEADAAWLAGDSERARTLYEARLREDPDHGTALLRVGLVHAWEGDYEVALGLIDRLLSLQPSDLEARLARARVRAWSGDLDAARTEVRQILELEPDNADALAALAQFLSWAGEHSQALASYDVLLAIAPGAGELERAQAQALAWAAELAGARAAYASLLERDPSDVEARLGLARTLSYSGRYDESARQYEEVLARAPDDVRALTGRARTLGWSGALVAAENAARQAVGAHPQSADAWSVLGEVYRWQRRTADAMASFEEASRLAPTHAAARDQLRALRVSLRPSARPTLRYEDDSEGNRMRTTALTAAWHPTARLEVRAFAEDRRTEQTLAFGVLDRGARRGSLTGVLEVGPGWHLTGALGASTSDGAGSPTWLEYRLGFRTPGRHRLVGQLDVSRAALHETAALTDREVVGTDVVMAGQWVPAPLWRVDAYTALGFLDGSDGNRRRGAGVSASRRVGRALSLGGAFRGFSFQKDVNDGYFDPDFYGVWEVTGSWLYRPGPWTVSAELAPGLQVTGTEGDAGSSLRSNARVAYRVGTGQEVYLVFSYSSAGLTSFATASSGYEYISLQLGVGWAF